MSFQPCLDFPSLYTGFNQSITALDCGKKCAPYNQYAVPFCCDTHHAIPTAYLAEWEHLQANTDLWHRWRAAQESETARLESETPAGQVLIECKGHTHCERPYRAITCRAFPFVPYITRGGEFLGLSYYWDYEDRCWVISNLDQVTATYVDEFVKAYETIFSVYPEEKEAFRYHSNQMRRYYGRRKRAIVLLHRNGNSYKVTPRTGSLTKISRKSLPKFGPYKIAAQLPFPDELPG